MGTVAEKLSYLLETKSLIKDAIEAKGVGVQDGVPFRQYADLILQILNTTESEYFERPCIAGQLQERKYRTFCIVPSCAAIASTMPPSQYSQFAIVLGEDALVGECILESSEV